MPRRERRGEERGERRDRAVHQPGEPRLDHAQDEHPPLRLVLLLPDVRRQVFPQSRSAVCSCCCSASARSPSSLRTEASVGARGRLPVEALGLEFHALRHLADGIEAERAELPNRAARDEAPHILPADQRNVFAEFRAGYSSISCWRCSLSSAAISVKTLAPSRDSHPAVLRRCRRIDAAVLLLVGDGQGEDFLFRQVGEISHRPKCGGWSGSVKSRPDCANASQDSALCAHRPFSAGNGACR